jgi:Zn finger protein HypA/HybF involved in hydrogenase expression
MKCKLCGEESRWEYHRTLCENCRKLSKKRANGMKTLLMG